jgi:hypothetical protein
MHTRPISDLHPNTRNPRGVTKKKLAMLKDAVKEFGDLGGVVLNLTTGTLIGGHQRIEAYKDCGSKQVVIERNYDPPSPAGTVREGYFMIAGERHAYREVQWSEAKADAACIAANKQAGEWNLPDLKDMLTDIKSQDFDMALTMFSGDEIDALLGKEKEEKEADIQIQENFSILVKCHSEEQQAELLERLQTDGYECKPLVA